MNKLPRSKRRVIVCRACHEPIREDEVAMLVPAGHLIHRRCGGVQRRLAAYEDDPDP